jgi:HIV Tat-specific factor 1
VIAEEIDSGEPRIKMYENEEGKFKGDALVVYFRPESVALAVQMLDDSDFRLGTEGPMGHMRVQAADFSYKSQQEAPEKKTKKDVSKIVKKTQKLNSKLADWDDDDPQTMQAPESKWDKVVILKHMFSLAELEDDPAAVLEIKEDIRDECGKLGEVTNVVLFDKEIAGVASVRFKSAESARACAKVS